MHHAHVGVCRHSPQVRFETQGFWTNMAGEEREEEDDEEKEDPPEEEKEDPPEDE